MGLFQFDLKSLHGKTIDFGGSDGQSIAQFETGEGEDEKRFQFFDASSEEHAKLLNVFPVPTNEGVTYTLGRIKHIIFFLIFWFTH